MEDKEKIEQECGKAWEKINHELQDSGGVNPHAYRYGFFDGYKAALEKQISKEGIKAIAKAAYNVGYLNKMDDELFEEWWDKYCEKYFVQSLPVNEVNSKDE